MFVNPNEKLRDVKIVNDIVKNDIQNFLKGAVYCWCKNKKNERFSLQSLMGDDNFYWQGTPLYKLYQEKANVDKSKAVEEAAKCAGWLLKKVLAEDKHRYYEIVEGYVNFYRCVKINCDLDEE